jgi:hypothetical protein
MEIITANPPGGYYEMQSEPDREHSEHHPPHPEPQTGQPHGHGLKGLVGNLPL